MSDQSGPIPADEHNVNDPGCDFAPAPELEATVPIENVPLTTYSKAVDEYVHTSWVGKQQARRERRCFLDGMAWALGRDLQSDLAAAEEGAPNGLPCYRCGQQAPNTGTGSACDHDYAPCPFCDDLPVALADDPAQVTLARVEAVLTSLMTISPPAFDSKREHPEFAHERCKLPNCNLRPWGLGNVSPDDLRYCAYHEGMSEAVTRIHAALVPGHDHEGDK